MSAILSAAVEKENVLALRRYTLKYLGAKGLSCLHDDICKNVNIRGIHVKGIWESLYYPELYYKSKIVKIKTLNKKERIFSPKCDMLENHSACHNRLFDALVVTSRCLAARLPSRYSHPSVLAQLSEQFSHQPAPSNLAPLTTGLVLLHLGLAASSELLIKTAGILGYVQGVR